MYLAGVLSLFVGCVSSKSVIAPNSITDRKVVTFRYYLKKWLSNPQCDFIAFNATKKQMKEIKANLSSSKRILSYAEVNELRAHFEKKKPPVIIAFYNDSEWIKNGNDYSIIVSKVCESFPEGVDQKVFSHIHFLSGYFLTTVRKTYKGWVFEKEVTIDPYKYGIPID